MKRLRTIAVVGASLAIIGAPLAYAGGLWFGLPVVGGATYCSTVTAGVPGTTPVCVSSAPAGPVSTTGNELIPADLNPNGTPGTPGLANSAAPQTGYIPLATAASGAYLMTNPGTLLGANQTVTVPNGISNVIVDLTGAITTLAVYLPVQPFDGQLVRVAATSTVTTLILWGTTPGVGTAAYVNTQTKPVSMGQYPQTTAPQAFTYLYSATGCCGATLGNGLPGWYRVQ